MRILKWISWALAALLLLFVLGLVVLVWVIDPNTFKPRIEAEVKKATGRDFRLVGDIKLGFYPWLALRTGPGSIGNPPGFPAEPMASWRSAQLGAKLIPLLGSELVVDRVHLVGADVRLVRHADGTANWQGFGGGQPVTPGQPTRHVTVDGVDIEDARLSFVDESTARRIEVTGLNLTTEQIAPDRPFTGTKITGRLYMQELAKEGVPFGLVLPEVELAADYSRVVARVYDLKFGGLEVQGGLDGTFRERTHVAGSASSNDFDLRGLLRSVSIEPPKTADPKALGKVNFTTTWKFDGGAIDVDKLALTVDDTHFTGNFQRGAGEDPVGVFELHGDVLNISRYIPPPDPQSEPFVLPTAALRALQFRGVMELEQATLDDVVMKGVTLRLVLDEQGLRSPTRVAAP